MRKIKFPVITTEDLKAGEILATTLESLEGITLKEMEIRLPISRKLKKSNSHVLLEEAEWKEVVNGIERTKWARMNEDIFAICKAALDAEEVEVKTK